MNEDLPSVNDFIEDKSNLPSINEEVNEDLPSYKDFLEKKEEEEEVLVEETVPQQTVVHEQTIIREVQDNSTIVSLIESLRDSIPEVKTYDKELFDLVNLIEEVRGEIPVVPEPPVIPEVRYYDEEIESLKEEVRSVSERDIPDFGWIGKSFSSIDSDFENVNNSISTLKSKLELDINDLVESIEVTKFETGVDHKSLKEQVQSVDSKVDDTKESIVENLNEVKDKIYEQLRDASLRIWNLNRDYKSDDKILKKEITEQYKKLKGEIKESVEASDTKLENVSSYFKSLVDSIPEPQIPEVKYYDEEIQGVSESVSHVKNLVSELENKLNKKIEGLKESILVNPPEDNKDPLTPLDQNFATLDDLSNHYRLFINRIQTQLASLGGGGETRLEFLDDVDRDTALVDGKFLKYQASTGKFVGATGGGGGGLDITGTSGDLIQHNGTEFVGVSSVGLGTFYNDLHQGYYRYSTNYYTTGVANTVQNLPADEFVLIQPSVRTNKTDFMPNKMLIANNNDPWIGAGATIGTGQTQFSLAGLDDGSTVIVRVASQFNPDVDFCNVDFRLAFTTNPTTQGYGTTNFNIEREQALICNEGAEVNYISETLINFYVGSSLSGMTTDTAGSFNLQVRSSEEGEFEMMALTINVVA